MLCHPTDLWGCSFSVRSVGFLVSVRSWSLSVLLGSHWVPGLCVFLGACTPSKNEWSILSVRLRSFDAASNDRSLTCKCPPHILVVRFSDFPCFVTRRIYGVARFSLFLVFLCFTWSANNALEMVGPACCDPPWLVTASVADHFRCIFRCHNHAQIDIKII